VLHKIQQPSDTYLDHREGDSTKDKASYSDDAHKTKETTERDSAQAKETKEADLEEQRGSVEQLFDALRDWLDVVLKDPSLLHGREG